jgi:hypothetical protein
MNPLPRGIAALLVGASLGGPGAGAFAASQLYKCVDGGRTVYQQQACSPSMQSDTALTVAPAMANASAPAADSAASAPRKIRASSSPASSALAMPR